MKFKLDECLDARLAPLLCDAGHDAVTVSDQDLRGIADPGLRDICFREDRVLITGDLGFSNVLVYPPSETAGIVVLRGPDDLLPTMRLCFRTFISALATRSPRQRLWIVEPSRVRIHDEGGES